MTGAKQASKPRPSLAEPPDDDGSPTPAEAPGFRLTTIWVRTPSGASIPTSRGALPSRMNVTPDVSLSVEGSRVIIERTVGGKRQRVSLAADLCVLEYE
jgi:hypothetical protein